jgi:hypothetical protein
LYRKRAIVVPAGSGVEDLLEMYDSKEFTGDLNAESCGTAQEHLQNLTENGESPTFFRSIASRKVMLGMKRRGG